MEKTVKDSDFWKFSKLVYEKSGINLTAKKKALFQSRMRKLMRRKKIDSFSAYYKLIESDKSGKELIEFIDRITTNVTSFFRGKDHFKFIAEKWIKDWKKMNREQSSGRREIRIWSAGCSKGAEPYSIAITILENLRASDYDKIKIFASDIATESLAYGKRGIYTNKEVKDVSHKHLKKYFFKGRNKYKGFVKIKPEIQDIVDFDYFNLMHDFSHLTAPFDLIFCRNTMIYFDKATKQKLVDKFYKVLKNFGYFFTGHSESLGILNHNYFQIRPSVYQKKLQ